MEPRWRIYMIDDDDDDDDRGGKNEIYYCFT